MKPTIISAGLMILALLHCLTPSLASAQTVEKKKALVAYFSKTGNTRTVALVIKENTNADIFEIEPVVAYPADYNETVNIARKERDSNARPAVKNKVENMDAYDVIFVGYPNWWGTFPMAVFTFLESYDFSGKTIIPFVTHEGSGLGSSVSDIEELCPNAKLLQGLAIRGRDAASAETRVPAWLKELNY